MMLARMASHFYWLGRYVERAEHTGRLLRHQLNQLVDRPADELAVGWQALYRALGQSPPDISVENVSESETFYKVDAYTLAGVLVEEKSNPASVLACWARARENARQVRTYLPLPVWTCLNQGHLWIQGSSFSEAWAKTPVTLVQEAIDRLRLFAGVVDGIMCRDDSWHFLQLGRFMERTQNQAALLSSWSEVACERWAALSLSWSGPLRMCGAYEVYCRRHSMDIRKESVLDLLIGDANLPRSLYFSVRRIEQMLAGIDPLGTRPPLAVPYRMILPLAAAIEMGPGENLGDFFNSIGRDTRKLHDLIISTYISYSPVEGSIR